MRLTRTGVGVLIASVAFVAAGMVLTVTASLCIGVIGLAIVAAATAVVSEAPRVNVRRTAHPPEVFRTVPASVVLTFDSYSARSPRPFIAIENVGGKMRSTAVPKLIAGVAYDVPYSVDTTRRGHIECGPMVVRRVDPFGLVTADRRIGGSIVVSVRPFLHSLGTLPVGRQRDLEGPTRERSQGSNSFHQLRDYVPGDDRRHIHWKSSARTGDLKVKQLVDTTRPEVVVVVDNRECAIDAASFEEAVDIANSVLYAAERDKYPVELHFADGSTDLGDDGRPIHYLNRLTAVSRADVESLQQVSQALNSRGKSLVLVTGDPSGADLGMFSKIAVGFSPAYLVSVVVERTAPLITPPGVHGIECGSAVEFAELWRRI